VDEIKANPAVRFEPSAGHGLQSPLADPLDEPQNGSGAWVTRRAPGTFEQAVRRASMLRLSDKR
jgi:hypothetical protein